MCCDEAHGCGATKRDWLSSAKFEGEEGSYLKWSFKGKFFIYSAGTATDYYYETKG